MKLPFEYQEEAREARERLEQVEQENADLKARVARLEKEACGEGECAEFNRAERHEKTISELHGHIAETIEEKKQLKAQHYRECAEIAQAMGWSFFGKDESYKHSRLYKNACKDIEQAILQKLED